MVMMAGHAWVPCGKTKIKVNKRGDCCYVAKPYQANMLHMIMRGPRLVGRCDDEVDDCLGRA